MKRALSHPPSRGTLPAVLCTVALLLGWVGVAVCADSAAASASGSWQVTCPQTGGCQMVQPVAPKPGEKPALLAMLSKDETSGAVIGVITVPLKVYLVPGIRITVDGKRPFKAAFELCDEAGCHAGFRAKGAVLDALSRGKKAEVTVWTGKDRAVLFPLALDGFTSAFRQVESGKAP